MKKNIMKREDNIMVKPKESAFSLRLKISFNDYQKKIKKTVKLYIKLMYSHMAGRKK